MDTNKDRFLTEEEFKKAQEAETKKMRAIIQAMQAGAAAGSAAAGSGPAARRSGATGARTAAPGPGTRPAAGHAVGDGRRPRRSRRSHAASPTMKRFFGPSLFAAAIATPAGGRTDSATGSRRAAGPARHRHAGAAAAVVRRDRRQQKGRVTRAEFLKVPHEVVRRTRRQQGRQAHDRGVQ